jgi:hypothetical protein
MRMASPSPRIGPTALSIASMFPPLLSRTSTIQPHASGCDRTAFSAAST